MIATVLGLLVLSVGGHDAVPTEVPVERIAAAHEALTPFEPLLSYCENDTRSEKRLWLVGDQHPSYFVRFIGMTSDEGVRGNILVFSECSTSTPAACTTEELTPDPGSWMVLYRGILNWEEAGPTIRSLGEEAPFNVFVESCDEGVYETFVFERNRDEASVISGFVLHAVKWWDRPHN